MSRRSLLFAGAGALVGAGEAGWRRWTLGGELLPAPSSVPAITTDDVVFLVPHQDDDVISMGVAIARAVREGRNVHVVEVTDGAVSSALQTINSKIDDYDSSNGAAIRHLTPATMSQARTREQLGALAALGVPASHIVQESVPGHPGTPGHPYLVTDEPRYQSFVDVVGDYASMYPRATICTMSWLDMHPDHLHLGYALDRLASTGSVEARFFQSPLYQWSAIGPQYHVQLAHVDPSHVTTVPRVATPRGGYLVAAEETDGYDAAALEYQLWDPPRGRFAVARYSVWDQLKYARAVRRSWIHTDSRHWTSPALRAAAARWVAAYQRPDLRLG